MVLEEEYTEAKLDITGWTGCLVLTVIPAAGFGACVVAGWIWASVPTIASLLAFVFCYRGMRTCERTIKAYRDQQRLELVRRSLADDEAPPPPHAIRPLRGRRG